MLGGDFGILLKKQQVNRYSGKFKKKWHIDTYIGIVFDILASYPESLSI